MTQQDNGYILVLEDDRGTCELEAQRLAPLGAVRKAYTAEEALAAIKGGAPRFMLVDYSLPGSNALEFIQTLRDSGSGVPPFMVVTGRGDEKVAVEAMKAGALDYLVKTAVFLDDLQPAVLKALDKLKLQRDLVEAQESTARNLRLYTFLAQVNLTAARTKDRKDLFRRICEIAVTAGDIRMAWIGLPDKDLGRLEPFCWAGVTDGYLDGIRIDLGGDAPAAKGPAGRAAATLAIQHCPDIAADPSMEPWRGKALARGYRSQAAIPLLESGRLAAVLEMYSAETGFFAGAELNLLEEIGGDISLALTSILGEEQRAAAQAALELTAAQLQHVMEANPVLLFTLRRNNGWISTQWVSGNSESMTGYEPAEILAPGWWEESLHPEDRGWAMAVHKNLPREGVTAHDFRVKMKSGRYAWFHCQYRPGAPGSGEVFCAWTDITQLKESEMRFQNLFEKLPVGYHSLDSDGNLLAVNDSWCETFGYSRAEVLGSNFSRFLVPEEKEAFLGKFAAFKSAGEVSDVNWRIMRKDGTARHLVFKGRIGHNADGTFKQTHCVFEDITERKAASDAMETQRRLLSDVINNSGSAIYALDLGGRFVIANKALSDILGVPGERIIGKTREGIVPPEYARMHMENDRKVIEGGVPCFFEEEVSGPAGRQYFYSSKFPLIDNMGKTYGVCGISTDITERKRGERLMRDMYNMQRVESLGELAGGIAHDFNNMLTGIMANLSLLAARVDGGENGDIVRETLDATKGAQALTAQLLSFSKGGRPVRKELCLEAALKDIFNLATRGASAAKELDVYDGLWSVEGDENQIKQAVNNILINGLQAMPSGGTIGLKAENIPETAALPFPLTPGKYVRVTVSDSGAGIAAENLTRIFEPYYSTKPKGHGLGLAMSWSVVKNHGGHIEVSSAPDKGTQFRVYLPATGRCLKEEARCPAPAPKGAGRILLLEDEEIVSRAAVRMLVELGYTCDVTTDGRQTLESYARQKAAGAPFNAVIMDLTIPGGMGGKEAVKELRRSDPGAVVIVSSGYSDEAVMADYRAYGFDAVLPKPYRYEELAETVSRLLKKE
jgi:two-component system cell cycle sensor histidine kinase/response regulator CckA